MSHFVSIIIPVKEINDYIRESIPIINQLDYSDFEIIILPNENNINFEAPNVRIVPSWKVWPAQKRNLWAKMAQWDILAFLDDDAYPRKDWLKNAVKYFIDKDIVGVWWPWITPQSDPFWAHVSGGVFLTSIGWWNPDRYIPGKRDYFTDDWPSVNLLIRNDDFLNIWWFNNEFWPWEDSKLCEDLVYKLNKKIIYSPNVVVWHHRRPNILKHLDQVGNYWLHRWFFAKHWDKNSRRFIYYIPSIFLLFLLVFGFSSLITIYIWYLFLLWLWLYFLALILAFFDIYLKNRKFVVSFFSVPLIFLTHIFYWYWFIKWHLKNELRSRLR